jgi:hypothetical protein
MACRHASISIKAFVIAGVSVNLGVNMRCLRDEGTIHAGH